MSLFKIIALQCCFLLAIAGSASAQGPSGFDPLSRLRENGMCRSSRAAPSDSAAVLVRVVEREGSEDQRNIGVAYAATGSPRYMTVFATQLTSAGHVEAHVITIRFGTQNYGTYTILADPANESEVGKAGAPVTESTSLQPLPVDMITRARLMAEDLWQARCGRP